MAVSQELMDFVRDALGHGVPRAQIEQVLRSAGWTAEQARGAVTAFAEVDFPVPVPRPLPYLSAREAFLYLVMFSTLYWSAFHLGSLLFEFVNRAFPDAADGARDGSVLVAIRWSVATLLVSFPVFAYVAWLIAKGVQRDPTKRASKIRRQLTYLTLFIASCALIGDVSTLIYNLLGGELTARFVLKALIVAAIAGTGFTYYLGELRAEEREPQP